MTAETPLHKRTGRPLSPCGTIAAYRRHYRQGEPVDEACEAANVRFVAGRAQESARQRQDKDAAALAAKIDGAVPRITVVDGRVLIDATLEDARMLAAAVLDRALSLERLAQTTAQAGEQRARAQVLRELHKRMAQATRAVG